MPRNSHLQWDVNYEPGTLEAVAYKNGKKLTSKVETTNHATKVIAVADKSSVLADGKDGVIVNISIVDDKGREVPNANNMVYFKLIGDAKIIGVGNGDPSSHEPDKCADGAWQRSAFNGKCQVIIQAGKTVGDIKLEVRSNGLVSASTSILSK
jgi:beta-galactosidase